MNRKLVAVAVVGLLAAGALLFPTAATPFSTDDGTDPVSEIPNITMSPADTPNGAYADIDSNGEIRLNLTEKNQAVAGDGVNPSAVTEIDNVFRITYTGDRAADVWLSHDKDDTDDDALRFYRGDDPTDSLEGESNNVTLSSMTENVSVSVLIDTTGGRVVEQIENFTVHAKLRDGANLAVETNPATGVDTSSATLEGDLTELEGDLSAAEGDLATHEGSSAAAVHFEYRESGTDGWRKAGHGTQTSPGSFSEPVDRLDAGTEYEFRAVANADQAADTGEIQTFTTDAGTSSQPDPTPTPTPERENPEETPDDEQPGEETPGEATPTPTPDDGTPTPDDGTPDDGTPDEGSVDDGSTTAQNADGGTPTPTPTPTPEAEAGLQGPDGGSGGGPTGGGLGQLLGGFPGVWLLLLLVLLLIGIGVAAALRTNLS